MLAFFKSQLSAHLQGGRSPLQARARLGRRRRCCTHGCRGGARAWRLAGSLPPPPQPAAFPRAIPPPRTTHTPRSHQISTFYEWLSVKPANPPADDPSCLTCYRPPSPAGRALAAFVDWAVEQEDVWFVTYSDLASGCLPAGLALPIVPLPATACCPAPASALTGAS